MIWWERHDVDYTSHFMIYDQLPCWSDVVYNTPRLLCTRGASCVRRRFSHVAKFQFGFVWRVLIFGVSVSFVVEIGLLREFLGVFVWIIQYWNVGDGHPFFRDHKISIEKFEKNILHSKNTWIYWKWISCVYFGQLVFEKKKQNSIVFCAMFSPSRDPTFHIWIYFNIAIRKGNKI